MLADMGTAHWDYAVPRDAHLGMYYLSMQMGERYVEGTQLLGRGVQEARVCGEGHGADAARAARPAHQGDHRRALLLRRAGGERQGEVGGAHLAVLALGPRRRRGRRRDAGGEGAGGDEDDSGGEQEEEKSGTLDADGKLQITVPTTVDTKHQDLVYRIEARVTDAGNREISGHGYALATYGSFFLTAEPNSYVYSKGSTATITVTAQDYDKKPVQTSFRVEMKSLELAKYRRRSDHCNIARTNRRQRQGAGEAHNSRCRRIPRAGHRDHA